MFVHGIQRVTRRNCHALLFITGLLASTINMIVGIPSGFEIDTKIGCRIRLSGQKCNPEDVRFTLFDRLDHVRGIELNLNNPIAGPRFDPLKPMKVICHGFQGGIRIFNPTYLIKEAFLQQEIYNIIMVDWSRLSTLPCYKVALRNTKFVGECTGQLLVALERSYPTFNAKKAHSIGFSMGSHVAAEASRTVQRLTGNKLERVTGLDPRQSRAYKTSGGYTWFIDPSCGDLVDIVYTHAGDQGREEMKGGVEFYVNGGSQQKQCSQSLVRDLCNHLTAPMFYAESITSPLRFLGIKCSDPAQCKGEGLSNNQTESGPMMGYCCSPGISGRYYIAT